MATSRADAPSLNLGWWPTRSLLVVGHVQHVSGNGHDSFDAESGRQRTEANDFYGSPSELPIPESSRQPERALSPRLIAFTAPSLHLERSKDRMIR